MHLCQIASFLFAIIDLYATSPLPPLETSSREVPIFLLARIFVNLLHSFRKCHLIVNNSLLMKDFSEYPMRRMST